MSAIPAPLASPVVARRCGASTASTATATGDGAASDAEVVVVVSRVVGSILATLPPLYPVALLLTATLIR
jgi:hypothetical protein